MPTAPHLARHRPNSLFAMVSDTALPQGQHGSLDVPESPGSSMTSPEEIIRYLCSICFKGYAQRQGAWLHIRTVHNPKQCLYCEFKYARPYDYKNHLKKHHPGANPDVTPGIAPGSPFRATVLTKRIPQPPPVSPAVEQGQQIWAESPPSFPPSSPVRATDTSVSPPAVSSVDCNSQPVFAEQIDTIDEHESAHGSEVLDATDHLARLLSTEERAVLNDSDIFLQDGQFGLPLAHPGTTRGPSNPDMAPIPTVPTSVVEIYGAIVSEDPVVEPYGLMRYPSFSDADYDAIFNTSSTNSIL